MNEHESKILILGGTGNYGTFITNNLINANVNCRLFTRNPEKAKRVFGNKIEIAIGNIEDIKSLRNAYQGIDRLICAISAFSVSQIRRYTQIETDAVISALRLAEEMGIRRLVYISVFEINKDFMNQQRLPLGHEKAKVEDYISKSNINWTILGCPPSMEIFFRMIHGNNMMVPGGGPKGLPSVSPYDVGEIIKQAILRDDLSGQRFQLVAPRTYSFPEAASIISEIWKKPIKFRKIPITFPKIAYHITGFFSPFSDRLLYIHNLLSFIRLLNNFPEDYIDKVPMIHKKLLSIFSYLPSSLEIEANRRNPGF